MEKIEDNLWAGNGIEIVPSLLARRLLEILPNKKGNKILEIGAREADAEGGHLGDDCIYLAREGNEVTLVEAGGGSIDDIKKKVEKQTMDLNIDFVIGSPEKLNLPSDEFDASFSLSGLDGTYLPDSLAEIQRVLKPGAKALLLIYYKFGERLIQGPEERLEEYILQSKLKIDSKQIRVIDSQNGLEVIIFELHK